MIVTDTGLMAVAFSQAQLSRDPFQQVGCVIAKPPRGAVIGTGMNRPPAGCAMPEDRDARVGRMIHAEKLAIMSALVLRGHLHDCTLYCTHPTCEQCAALIVEVGIRRVVVADQSDQTEAFKRHWFPSWERACVLYDEAEVERTGWVA